MNNKFLNRILRIINAALVLLLIFPTVTTSINKSRYLYIDPFFGGKESGPIFFNNYRAKNLTLDISRKIASLFDASEIKTYFSRDDDYFVSAVERLSRAKIKSSELYVAITLSRSNKNYINIYYPQKKQDKFQNKDVNNILTGLTNEYINKNSHLLAETIKSKLKTYDVPIHFKNHAFKSYILENAFCPTIIIDFGVLDSSSEISYIFDTAIMNKILSAISDGVKEYFEK